MPAGKERAELRLGRGDARRAGFIGHAIGIWASIFWGAVLIGGLALYGRRRSRQPQGDS